MMSLIKMFVVIILIGHIIACVWHGVAHYANESDMTWIKFRGLSQADNITLYNYSFYFATMTMTTVGYGGKIFVIADITPQNNYERIICNITMFMACGVFAFSVNSIGIVLQNLYKSRLEYVRSVTLINNFMSKNKIEFQL
jgi:Ion channel